MPSFSRATAALLTLAALLLLLPFSLRGAWFVQGLPPSGTLEGAWYPVEPGESGPRWIRKRCWEEPATLHVRVGDDGLHGFWDIGGRVGGPPGLKGARLSGALQGDELLLEGPWYDDFHQATGDATRFELRWLRDDNVLVGEREGTPFIAVRGVETAVPWGIVCPPVGPP